jgi:oligopeptide/dipeptide ABC transporter ATP-binding protein
MQAHADAMKPAVAADSAGSGEPLLRVCNLRRWYDLGRPSFGFGSRRHLKAVDNISFDVAAGSTFGLVGESGCGKTTTLRLILQLERPTAGNLYFEGEDIATLSAAGRRHFRCSVQAVFQDPWASLNPRMRVRDIVAEPLEIASSLSRRQIRDRVAELLAEVGLNPYQANLYPHEFSGGQRQRICIARALGLKPKLIVLDEPVSALDVSIRAQILNLLARLQKQHGIAYLLVSHDLAIVRHLCDRMAVMYLGVIQEIGSAKAIFARPLHLYTRALMSATLPAHPDIVQEELILPGEVVSPINPPPGDVFISRTPLPVDFNHRWARERPPLVEKEPDHWVVDTPWSLA